MNHAMRVFKRNVKTLDDLTSQEINQANSMLTTFVEKKGLKSVDKVESEVVQKEKPVLKNDAPGSELDGSGE